MATASAPGPGTARGAGHVLRVLVVPGICAVVALLVSGFVGHLTLGLLLSAGVALGVVNGLLMEAATERLTPQSNPTRKVIVKSAMGRLGLITAVALAIAFFARPDGWLLLLGLALYQLLSLAATIGAAAKEARLG
ncbi:MAG: hypothetical protein M3N21_06300 [Actinomycetota bacterium]|nr:hypothetical protein [Actinomycetota bacterium]